MFYSVDTILISLIYKCFNKLYSQVTKREQTILLLTIIMEIVLFPESRDIEICK